LHHGKKGVTFWGQRVMYFSKLWGKGEEEQGNTRNRNRGNSESKVTHFARRSLFYTWEDKCSLRWKFLKSDPKAE